MWPSKPIIQQNFATFVVVTLGTALFTSAASLFLWRRDRSLTSSGSVTTKHTTQTKQDDTCGNADVGEEKKVETDQPIVRSTEVDPDPMLIKFFDAAADEGKTLTNITNTEKLILYSLYKQATKGDAPNAAGVASMFNFVEKAKLSAWQKLRGMPKIQATMQYMDAVHQLKHKKENGDGEEDMDDDMPMAGGFGNRPSMMGELGMDDVNNDSREMTREEQLLQAASHNDCAHIEKLLTDGDESAVDVNFRDEDGQTALHLAADKGSTDAMKVLLQAAGGVVDINAADADGISVLQAAVIGENVEACQLLLQAGADPDKPDNDGDTPRSCAHEDGSDELRALFEQYSSPLLPQLSEADSTATGVTSDTTATPGSPKEEYVV